MATGDPLNWTARTAKARPAAASDVDPCFLPEPQDFSDLGISPGLVMELALKEMYFERNPTALNICNALGVPFVLIERILETARAEQFIQTVRSDSHFEQQFQYGLTDRGHEKVKEFLAVCQYRGPVPVPFSQYYDIVRKQTVRGQTVLREDLEKALGDLILSREVLDQVGPGINSGTCIFLYGASGNGKTSIATHLRNLFKGPALIPHAVEIDGQIVKVFDPIVHEVKTPESPADRRVGDSYLKHEVSERRDRRWVLCSRPVLIVGGELTLDKLEFQYDTQLRYHQAPLQMKAAGGLLVIDDFGRQRVSPRDILNRWIVPMDRGVDYLPLPTGETIELPFDLLLVFSTNLHPLDVVDEAFLRRLRHKVFIPNPTLEQFASLMFKEAAARNLEMSREMLDRIVARYYQNGKEMRSCHPKDILSNVDDIRRYEGDSSPLSLETLVRAADSYFLFEQTEKQGPAPA